MHDGLVVVWGTEIGSFIHFVLVCLFRVAKILWVEFHVIVPICALMFMVHPEYVTKFMHNQSNVVTAWPQIDIIAIRG